MQRLRLVAFECSEHLLHGVARVDDVLNDDDVASLEFLVDTDELFDLTHRGGALVGSQLHERNLAGDGKVAHQVGCKDKRPIEHSEKQRVLARHVFIELFGNGFYFALNL